ncbi:MAG: FHA domain-containing protein [Pseudomonadota bacterium]
MTGSPVIVDLTDNALRVHDGGQTVDVSVGYASVIEGAVTAIGRSAFANAKRHPRRTHNDFWYRLSAEPMESASGLSRADLVAAQWQALVPLERLAGRSVILILPSFWQRDALALLLGILKTSGVEVAGMIDAAVAATRDYYQDQVLLHVDITLHCASVVRLVQSRERSELDDARAIEGSGWVALMEDWVKFFAAQFVRQCRFDPLHSAETEQLLFDALPVWLTDIEKRDDVSVTLTAGGRDYTATILRVDVINAVAAHYQRIADVVRALHGGGPAPALQMRVSISGLPGLAELLAARSGGQYFAVADDAAAASVSSQIGSLGLEAGRVRREMAVTGVVHEAAAAAMHIADMPSHLLYGDRAFLLAEEALAVGSGTEQPPARYLLIEGSPAGVSGLHCELRLERGGCTVVDRSRYGTFLNGNRINGSAALQIGDTLRVGTPGRELLLIREERF